MGRVQYLVSSQLNNFGGHRIQASFRTAACTVSGIIGSVSTDLTDGARSAPKRAAAVFASLTTVFGNLILGSNVLTGTDQHHQNEETVDERKRLVDAIHDTDPRRNVVGQYVLASFFVVFASLVGVGNVVHDSL